MQADEDENDEENDGEADGEELLLGETSAQTNSSSRVPRGESESPFASKELLIVQEARNTSSVLLDKRVDIEEEEEEEEEDRD